MESRIESLRSWKFTLKLNLISYDLNINIIDFAEHRTIYYTLHYETTEQSDNTIPSIFGL